MRRRTKDPTDDIHKRLGKEVKEAKALIKAVLRDRPSWFCPHCNQERTLGEPPWPGSLIKEASHSQIRFSSSVENIAFMQLEKEEYLHPEGFTWTYWPDEDLLRESDA